MIIKNRAQRGKLKIKPHQAKAAVAVATALRSIPQEAVTAAVAAAAERAY